MNRIDEPFLTTCELCNCKVAAMPVPRVKNGRPEPPAGYTLGFEVEMIDRFGAERSYPICSDCLRSVLQTAA